MIDIEFFIHLLLLHLDDIVAPIDSTNINSQLSEKVDWTSIPSSVQTNDRHVQHGLGHDNTPMDTSEQSPALSSHVSRT